MTEVENLPAWQQRARAIARSGWFQTGAILVIIANAVVIGANTFDIGERMTHTFNLVDRVFLGIFTVELLIRLAADGFKWRRFFASGWNIFDFLVVALCYVPGISTSTSALRIVRLLRVGRLLRVMPDIQVLMRGLRRAGPPAASLLALTILICYLYAIVGWMLFGGKGTPGMRGYFDNVGEAMLTLFELLTLEGWNATLHDLRQVSPWALPFVVSFLLIGTYVVVNLVVGIVITSLDQAYEERERAHKQAELEAEPHSSIGATVKELREQLEKLELQLEQAKQKR